MNSKFLSASEWRLLNKYEPKQYPFKPYPKKKIEGWYSYDSPYPLYKMFKDFGIADKKVKQSIVRTFWRLLSLNDRFFYIEMFYSQEARDKYARLSFKKLDINTLTNGWQDW